VAGRIVLSVNSGVAELRLNRPDMLNALNGEMLEDLHTALDTLEESYGLRVVVVAGAGASFSTGLDLKALAAGEISTGWFQGFEEELARLERLGAVTVAKLHGYALGGGLLLALACDLRVAADNTQVGLPAVLSSMVPGMGVARLRRFVGLGRARRMALCAETFSAGDAFQMGLVDWLAPAAELEARTAGVVDRILKGSHTAQRLTKKLMASGFENGVRELRETYLDFQQQALASANPGPASPGSYAPVPRD
jgi:enoyl-CoA hydratase/carnithine racemase